MMAKKTDNKKLALATWLEEEDITPQEKVSQQNEVKQESENSLNEDSTIVKEHLKNNKNFSAKRNKQEEGELPKKLKFLEKEIDGSNHKILYATALNHQKIKLASQLCGVEIQQLTNNIIDNFFNTYKKELNELRDNKMSF